jgi:hypothetical protein
MAFFRQRVVAGDDASRGDSGHRHSAAAVGRQLLAETDVPVLIGLA